MKKKFKILNYNSLNEIDLEPIRVYTLIESLPIIKDIIANNGYAELYPEDYTEDQLEVLKKQARLTIKRRYKIINISHLNGGFENIDLSASYSFFEAVNIVKQMREDGLKAEFYPEEYAHTTISEDQAFLITLKKYDEIKSLNPDNYGELHRGGSTPVYYSFYCRDYEKEAQGMTPGHYTITIDKLDGHLLSSDEIKSYSKLNYSF